MGIMCVCIGKVRLSVRCRGEMGEVGFGVEGEEPVGYAPRA